MDVIRFMSVKEAETGFIKWYERSDWRIENYSETEEWEMRT